ncbi:MAG: Transcriptional regulator, AraC family [Verrucomicrobiaceae bacterium]|nr:Transcriptional regulator, AraC family [Verrucomicrobiaceae bacterium]
MQIAQESIFTSSTQVNAQLEGRLQNKAYDIQVHDLEWITDGEGVLKPNSSCFLELIFNPESIWEGTYAGRQHHDGFQNLGPLLFAPPDTTMHCRWDKGRQQTIGCMFDIDSLSALHGFDWDWAAIDLQRTFDVQNPFLLAGLRRLAEEAVTPSFASELQAECTLVLLALELRRHFLGTPKDPEVALGKLSHRQMCLVNELIDSAIGSGPSLDDFAEACDIPARQLSIMFKRVSGMTLRNYVANARLKKAKNFLSDQRLMVKQVAYMCGFKSAAAFAAAFRKEVGVTPQEFRESLGQIAETTH